MNQKPPPGQTTITITTTDGYPPQQQPYVPAQPYVPPTQPAYPPIYAPPPQDGWFERNQRNKPQSNSVGSAALIFVTGGMNIAWGVGYTLIWTSVYTEHMQMSWFIGGIIGAALSSIATNYVPRKLIHYFATLLAVLGAIIFSATAIDYDGFLAARYLNGIANGLVFVTTMTLVGEQSFQNLRGQIAISIETLCFSLGFFIQVLLLIAWQPTNSQIKEFNLVHGIICLVIAIVAVAFVPLFMIESPIYYLQRGEEQEALECLRRLRSPAIVNEETYAVLEEQKRYINVNNEMSLEKSVVSGLPALIKLCLLRGLSAMANTQMIVYALAILSVFTHYDNTKWIFIMHGVMRVLGALISTFIVDAVGRKPLLLISMAGSACMGFALGSLLTDLTVFVIAENSAVGIQLLLFMQLFSSIFAATSSAYISEAFPLAVKSYYIGCTFIVEMIIGLCMFKVMFFSSDIYYYVFGSLAAAYLVLSSFMMPETKQTSLREAQAKFRNFINGFSFR